MCHSATIDGGDLFDSLHEFSAALKAAGAKGIVYIHGGALTDAGPDRCLCGTDFERTAKAASEEIGCRVRYRYDPEFWDHHIRFVRDEKAAGANDGEKR
jgi:hypothetical protein